jgi:hypothetical protein
MPSPSWFNENENRAYPLMVGDANPPESLLVDAGFIPGTRSRFETGVHIVRLTSIRREGSFFYITFASDAPELFDAPLIFTRTLSDDDFSAEFVDSGTAGLSASSASGSTSASASDSLTNRVCDEPLWSGFLVTGRMTSFVELLPVDGEVTFSAKVEPALLQNLAESYVSQLATANVDRTRVTPTGDCPGGDVEVEEVLHVNARCLLGDVVFVSGFNANITQNGADNSITIGAYVGAGAGEPCETVKTYPTETAPAGSSLLEGGPRCNQTLRSVNGMGGPILSLLAGKGVTITSVPEENKLIVNVNMSGLALCFDSISQRSESC